MTDHYVIIDTECYLKGYGAEEAPTEENVIAFLGILYKGKHIVLDSNKLTSFAIELRRRLPREDRIIFIVYNWDYDGRILEFAEDMGENYSKVRLFEFSNDLIMSTRKDRIAQNKYPKWEKRIKGIEGIYVYDVCEELKGASTKDDGGSKQTKGSVEYHATREGYVYRSTIDDDIYAYNLSDLEALDLIFRNQGGIDDLAVKLYQIEEILNRKNMPIISRKMIASTYIYNNKINESKKGKILANDEAKYEAFRNNFIIPWDGYYANNCFYFYKNVDGKRVETKLLHKFEMVSNSGGLHKGVDNLILRSNEEWSVFNIDFSAFYGNVISGQLFPLYTDFTKKLLNTLKEMKEYYKQTGEKVKEKACKDMVNIIYGFLKKMGLYATSYATFIAQVSIVNFMTCFKEDGDTYIVDLNTDGINIYTKLSYEEVVEICERFDSECTKRAHFSKLEVTRVDVLYYNNFNNYLYMKDGKVVKKKGAFLNNTKLQKNTKIVEIDGVPTVIKTPSYNVVNYDFIVEAFLEGRELPKAKCLKREDGKKIQVFDGLPFDIYELDNPSLSERHTRIVGHTSAEDLSIACVRGFLSRFSKTEERFKMMQVVESIDQMNKNFVKEDIVNKRKNGEAFVMFNEITELSISYMTQNLVTYDSPVDQDKLILLPNNIIYQPKERMPYRIVDIDFKNETNIEAKEDIIAQLIDDPSGIIYGEWYEGDCEIFNGNIKKGIHLFVTCDSFEKRFSKFHPSLQDKQYRSVVSRKNITLYRNTNTKDILKLKTIGHIDNLIELIKKKEYQAPDKEPLIKRKASNLTTSKVLAELDELAAAATRLASNELEGEAYSDWFQIISAFSDNYFICGLNDNEIIERLIALSERCEITSPQTSRDAHDTRSILTSRVRKSEENVKNGKPATVQWLKKKLLAIGAITPNEKVINEQLSKIDSVVNYPHHTYIDIQDFFKLPNRINCLKASTGSGKTESCSDAIVKSIKQQKPFIYLTDTKDHAKYFFNIVLTKLRDVLTPEEMKDFATKSLLLSSATNNQQNHKDKCYYFSTHHYFYRKQGDVKTYAVTEMLLRGNESFDVYIDEVDEYFKGMEFVIANGARYRDEYYKHLGNRKDKIEYCPFGHYNKHGDNDVVIDKRDICKECTFHRTTFLQPEVIRDDSTFHSFTQYKELDHINTIDPDFKKDYFDFEDILEYDQEPERCVTSTFYARKITGVRRPVADCPESIYVYNKLNHSTFLTKCRYYPEDEKGTKIENPTCVSGVKYPHYPCGVSVVSGVDTFVLVMLLRMVLKRRKSLYMFSATFQRKYMDVLNTLVKQEVQSYNSNIPLYLTKKCFSKQSQIVMLHKSGDFNLNYAVKSKKLNTKIIMFLPRKKDAQLVFKNNNDKNSGIALYDKDNYLANCKTGEFEKIRILITYSRSSLGRGETFDGDVCIVSGSIYKPRHAYVVYNDKYIDYEIERLCDQLIYVLQNIGRVLRGDRKKVLILCNVTKPMIEYIKKELAIRSKEDIIDICVTGHNEQYIMDLTEKQLNKRN